MKSYLGHIILMLTILIRMESLALDGDWVYDSNLSPVSDTEWVHDDNFSGFIEPTYFNASKDQGHTGHLSGPIFTHPFFTYLQPFFYPDKLQPSEGYVFVSASLYIGNIPHRNSKDEEPYTPLG